MSANKAKGTRWETTVVNYLNSMGLKTYRPAQAGVKDTGDIHGLTDFAIQCKDWKNITDAVRSGTDGAEAQSKNLGVPFGINIVKRARKPVGDAYVVIRLSTFVSLLQRAFPNYFN